MANRLVKAYEMNSFAVANGFSQSSRGCPRGFAVIESCIKLNEYASLCWCADNLTLGGRSPSYDKAAFAMTNMRLICAGKTGAGYIAQSIPIQVITGAAAKRKKLFSKPEVVIFAEGGEIRFSCVNQDEASKLAESISDILYN